MQTQIQVHPNMAIRDVSDVVKRLGGSVHVKRNHGELVFSHPEIKTPYVISINKESIGKTFLSWIKPIMPTEENNSKSKDDSYLAPVNPGTFKWHIAQAMVTIYLRDKPKEIPVDRILRQLMDHDSEFVEKRLILGKMRKQIQDGLIWMRKDDLVERVNIGTYLPKSHIVEFFKSSINTELTTIEEDIIEPYEEPKIEQEAETKITSVVNEVATPENIQQLEQRMEAVLKRFEELTIRFEQIVERFEEAEEVKDAVAILKEVMKKRIPRN